MLPSDARRRSRWILRVHEWDEPGARYPNLWRGGMPRRIQAFDTVAERLRLGDLIAVFSPASSRHPERSERFTGIARVSRLERADDPKLCWVELETAHRFEPPLQVAGAPRRVFMCCDPGWPAADVRLFQEVFDAAARGGWQPAPEETVPEAAPPEPPAPRPTAAVHVRANPVTVPAEGAVFGGVDFSGALRDPRDATWLALVHHDAASGRLRTIRLEPTGRAGLRERLRDPDRELLRAAAIGLDVPFGLPLAFAETILGGPFPEDGWWALAHRFEKLAFPEYLTAIQEFRDAHGEPKRHTDERAAAFSPLHRVNPDLGPMTYHGVRLIAEERSRYAIRPFETAKGRLLLEVYPGGSLRQLGLQVRGATVEEKAGRILEALQGAVELPVDVDDAHRGSCLASRDALDAVAAARCAARAFLSGEADRRPEELAPEAAGQVRHEGWIYGLA